VLPKDLPSLTYQVRKKGGQPFAITVEDEEGADSINADWAQSHSTTLDKIISVLANGGAQLRKKRSPRRQAPSMYD